MNTLRRFFAIFLSTSLLAIAMLTFAPVAHAQVSYTPCANVGSTDGPGNVVPNGQFQISVGGISNNAAICDMPTLDASGNPADYYWLEIQNDANELLSCSATLWIVNADGTEQGASGTTNFYPGATSDIVETSTLDNTTGIDVPRTRQTIQCSFPASGGGGGGYGGGGAGGSGGGSGGGAGGSSFYLAMSGAASLSVTWNSANVYESSAAISLAEVEESLPPEAQPPPCMLPTLVAIFSTSPYQTGNLGQSGWLGNSGWLGFSYTQSNACNGQLPNPITWTPYAGAASIACGPQGWDCVPPPTGTYYVALVLLSAWSPAANEPCNGVIDQNFLPAGGYNPSALCEWAFVNLNNQITVPVNNPNPFVTLTSNASTVTAGAPVKLSWSTQSAIPGSCGAGGGNASDGWIGSLAASGSQSVTEQTAGTYTYSIYCEVGYQTVKASTKVTVQAASGGGSGSSGGSSGSSGGSSGTSGGSSGSSSGTSSSSGGGGAFGWELLVLLGIVLILRDPRKSRLPQQFDATNKRAA